MTHSAFVSLSDYYLLHLHVIAVDEAQDVNARGHPSGGNGGHIRCVPTDQHTPLRVDQLQRCAVGSLKQTYLTVGIEGESRIVAVCVLADGSGGIHQLEALRIVGSKGLKGVRERRRLRVLARNEGRRWACCFSRA